MSVFVGLVRDGLLVRRPRHEPARRRRALLRRLRDLRRASASRSRATSRSSTPRSASCSGRSASRSTRPRRWTSRSGPAQGADRRAVPHPDARRVGRVLRRPRRVLRAGAHDERGARPSAQRRARRSSTSTARPSPRPRPASPARRAQWRRPVVPGADTDTALVDWGFAPDEVAALKDRRDRLTPATDDGHRRHIGGV